MLEPIRVLGFECCFPSQVVSERVDVASMTPEQLRLLAEDAVLWWFRDIPWLRVREQPKGLKPKTR